MIEPMPEKPKLMVLGGSPRAGKSQLSQRMWKQRRVVTYAMDNTLLGMHDIGLKKVHWTPSAERDGDVAKLAAPVARWGSFTYDRFMIEGETMTPPVANLLSEEFDVTACFLVMSNPSLGDIQRHENFVKWVTRSDDAAKEALLKFIVRRSEEISAQAEAFGYPCIDMSVGRYQDRRNEALRTILSGPELSDGYGR